MSHFHRKYPLRSEATEGGEGGGGEAVVVEKDDAKPAPQAEQTPEVEGKARKMGWVPKEEFRGDPDKWRPAEEFVERGENMLPLVKAQVKRQEREIAELKQTMQQFAEYHSKTEARAYEKALSDLREQRAAAIAAGDGVAFDKVDTQIEDLRKELDSKKTPAQVEQETPEFREWLTRNSWANDQKLQVVGKAIADALVMEGEPARGTALLDLVAKEIKLRYPEKFENPRRNGVSSVEGSGTTPRKSGKSYADLPQEAKEACDRFIRQKLTTKERYVKQFFDQE
jgi:hypothetical protein